MNKIYSLFLLVIVLCLGCNSDDNGTNPNNPNFPGSGNNSIVWDDWYWEFTFDTITYRCEGFYPKSVAVDDYEGQYEVISWIDQNTPRNLILQESQNTEFILQIADRSYPSWTSGDECEIQFDIINSPPQPSQTEAYIYTPSSISTNAVGYGQSIQQYIVNTFYNGNSGAYIRANTSNLATATDDDFVLVSGTWADTISMFYTPGNFSWVGLEGYSSEPSIGESSFTLYFYEGDGGGWDEIFTPIGSVNCTLRFKAPSIWEYW